MTNQNLKNLIFNKLINLYIKKASPIGSRILKRKYFNNLAESTVRLYLNKLVEEKYLITIQKSVGRIPTDKGWKYYLEINKESIKLEKLYENIDKHNRYDLIDYIANKFNLYYILKSNDKLTEGGLEYVLKNAEFENKEILLEFAQFLRTIKERFLDRLQLKDEEIKILIGRDISLENSEKFSLIATRKGKNTLLYLNVKRMDYPLIYKIFSKIIMKRL